MERGGGSWKRRGKSKTLRTGVGFPKPETMWEKRDVGVGAGAGLQSPPPSQRSAQGSAAAAPFLPSLPQLFPRLLPSHAFPLRGANKAGEKGSRGANWMAGELRPWRFPSPPRRCFYLILHLGGESVRRALVKVGHGGNGAGSVSVPEVGTRLKLSCLRSTGCSGLPVGRERARAGRAGEGGRDVGPSWLTAPAAA